MKELLKQLEAAFVNPDEDGPEFLLEGEGITQRIAVWYNPTMEEQMMAQTPEEIESLYEEFKEAVKEEIGPGYVMYKEFEDGFHIIKYLTGSPGEGEDGAKWAKDAMELWVEVGMVVKEGDVYKLGKLPVV